MWLGLLFMLGTSLLLSGALDSALLAVVGTFLVWMLTSVAPAFAAHQAVAFLSTQNAPLVTVFDALTLSPYKTAWWPVPETAFQPCNCWTVRSPPDCHS
jgi:hypothetical protein